MKKLYVLSMVTSLLAGVFIGYHAQEKPIEQVNTTEKCSQIAFYDNMIQNTNTIEIYDTNKLTHDIMENRNGKIIVEKVIGEVTDNDLNGKILNAGNEQENYTNKNDSLYINYERVNGAKEGDKIVTYFIYNPFTKAQDDVLTRMDFIIDEHAI